jgi:hypothetical protein
MDYAFAFSSDQFLLKAFTLSSRNAGKIFQKENLNV